MGLTGLESSLISIIGGIVLLALGYWLGGRGKQTVVACTACQDACRKDMQGELNGIKAKQAELSARQDERDDEMGKKLDIVFRMLRQAIMYLPINEKEKAEIINERGGK